MQRAEGLTKRQAEAVVDASVDRLVWYAGWADKIAQVVGGTNPVAGAVLQLLAARAHRRGRASLAPQAVLAARAGQRRRAGHRHRQHRAWSPRPHARPLPAITLRRGAGHLRRARRRRQRAHRRAGATPRRRSPRTWTSTPSTSPASGDAETARELEVAAAENLKRVVRARAAEPDWTLEPGLDRMTAFLETKTVWHPIGI